jgi:arylsulfatase
MKRFFLITLSFILAINVFAQDRPYVVLMLADNVGYGDISCYNLGIRGGMKTPNIDRIAEEGIQFTQFMVEPGCTPTRAGLMTGQYSIRNGMSMIIAPGAGGGLGEDDFTLGKLFKQAGYNTAYSGKWHLGPQAMSQPQNQGFDKWLIGFKGTTDQVLYKESMKATGAPQAMIDALASKVLTADGPGEPTQIGDYDFARRLTIEGEITEKAIGYIEEQKRSKEPFFLMVGFTRSHFPNDVSEEFKGKSGVGKYGDSMYELDYRTGQIIEALEKNGFEDNTIVIWLSDNAATVTGTAVDEVHQGDNGPFRGELGDAYEGSIRTAGMIKWPGVIKPRTRSNGMISVHDFLPTFASILGEELPSNRPYDGVNQADFITGKQKDSNRNSLITFIGGRIAAIRWNQYRIYPLLVGNTSNDPSNGGYVGTLSETAGFPQIFNIELDPKERVDQAVNGSGWVLGVYPNIIAEYKKTLKKYPNPPVPNLTKF